MQNVKQEERVACSLFAMLSSLPLTLDMASRSGILVATGMFRKDAPRAAQEAAKAFHSHLQQSNPSAQTAAGPTRRLPPATTAATGTSGRTEDVTKASAALPDAQTGKPSVVLKLNDDGLIEGLDEALLKQLPPEQVCAYCSSFFGTHCILGRPPLMDGED